MVSGFKPLKLGSLVNCFTMQAATTCNIFPVYILQWVPFVAEFELLNLGSLDDCFTSPAHYPFHLCSTFLPLPLCARYFYMLNFFGHYFHLVTVVARFSHWNLGTLLDCSANCAALACIVAFCHFCLVQVVAGSEYLKAGSLVDCFTSPADAQYFIYFLFPIFLGCHRWLDSNP
jgi:hypothetical protein